MDLTSRGDRTTAAIADPGDRGGPSVASGRLGVVLLVVAASVVVALASDGLRVIVPPASLDPRFVSAVRWAGAFTVLTGFAGLLLHRRRLMAELDGEEAVGGAGDPSAGSLRRAATIIALVALVGLILNPLRPSSDDGDRNSTRFGDSPAAGASGGAGTSTGAGPVGGQGTPGGGGVGGAAAARGGPAALQDGAARPGLLQRAAGPLRPLLLLALVGLAVLMLRRGLRPVSLEEDPEDDGLEPQDALGGFEASLQALLASGDPRDQVTLAYLRLLDALAWAGFSRRPHEAPYEHLRRVLVPLGVRPEPLHRLAGLYVLVQFGPGPVTERHRDAALAALEAGLDDLRAVDAQAADGGTGRIVIVAP